MTASLVLGAGGMFVIWLALAYKIYRDDKDPNTKVSMPFVVSSGDKSSEGVKASQTSDRTHLIIISLIVSAVCWWAMVFGLYAITNDPPVTPANPPKEVTPEIPPDTEVELTLSEMAVYRESVKNHYELLYGPATQNPYADKLPTYMMEEYYLEQTSVGPASRIVRRTSGLTGDKATYYYWDAPDGTEVLEVEVQYTYVFAVNPHGSAYWNEDGTPCWDKPRDLEAENEARKAKEKANWEKRPPMPYVGMSEKDIAGTKVGRPSYCYNEASYMYDDTYGNCYVWRVTPTGGDIYNEETVLEVHTLDGYVVGVDRMEQYTYWKGNGEPRWDDPAPRRPYVDYDEDDTIRSWVLLHDDPKGYYEVYEKYYIEGNKEVMPDEDPSLIEKQAKKDAYNDWYRYHP